MTHIFWSTSLCRHAGDFFITYAMHGVGGVDGRG